MEYDFAAFKADLAAMGYKGEMLPTPVGLKMRLGKLAHDASVDQGAAKAAYERLTSWAEKCQRRMLEPPPEIAPEGAEKGREAAEAAWRDAAYAGQLARHQRRRRSYPQVRPMAAG